MLESNEIRITDKNGNTTLHIDSCGNVTIKTNENNTEVSNFINIILDIQKAFEGNYSALDKYGVNISENHVNHATFNKLTDSKEVIIFSEILRQVNPSEYCKVLKKLDVNKEIIGGKIDECIR